jgi:hypothetical protein
MVQTEGWKDKDSIDIPVIQKITVKVYMFLRYNHHLTFLQFAFLVISACGFGFPSTWFVINCGNELQLMVSRETPQAADGSMSAQEALNIVSDTPLIQLFVPKWLWYLPIPR